MMPQKGESRSTQTSGEPAESRDAVMHMPKQGHVVHEPGSSIVCISAGVTPLHMSAAVGGMHMEGLTPHQPHTEGESQPVPTTLSALRHVVSCPRLFSGDDIELEDSSFSGLKTSGGSRCVPLKSVEADVIKRTVDLPEEGGPPLADSRYEEVAVPELKAKLLRCVDERMRTDPSTSHVLIIILGGTICMDYAYRNTCLRPQRLAKKLVHSAELKEESLPQFDVLEWDSLVDSSDIGEAQYCNLARQIEKYYNDYDGFVILHGTDTMAYTASVLSFMLENVGKPVVLTGSMLPMMHISSDAKRNVGLSLMVAGYSELTEVVVVFGSQVLRGTRVTKANCASIDAFSSPNFPAIGSIGVDVVIHDSLRASPPTGEFRIFTDLKCGVCTVKLTPGMPVEVLEGIFSTQVRPFAVVLELYGAGTAPNNDRFLDTIKKAIDSGIAVVASTQCQRGATNLLIYENGVWISSLGVICARDMTQEAITAKLYYLMGKGVSGKRLKELMETNMRGEVTVSPNRVQGRNAVDDASHTELAQKIARGIADKTTAGEAA